MVSRIRYRNLSLYLIRLLSYESKYDGKSWEKNEETIPKFIKKATEVLRHYQNWCSDFVFVVGLDYTGRKCIVLKSLTKNAIISSTIGLFKYFSKKEINK